MATAPIWHLVYHEPGTCLSGAGTIVIRSRPDCKFEITNFVFFRIIRNIFESSGYCPNIRTTGLSNIDVILVRYGSPMFVLESNVALVMQILQIYLSILEKWIWRGKK